ncbi:efflux transporter, RND family, MFP subunit [Caldithrix abyssi DSM 13497]|uniref:Efflux transporter, RND family, MFP subunit n=1 Tax=Caldithrix abyssi DSM 13497 TaxID=880073 RepID=H1XX48_CALAY|nr:efflux RND transporter periplasmic adaptor subunit [Caldithrix abyssi]APF20716.1 HlyD family secretion protein [Caldithrix abyssi DSM 13497]EHO40785.1 efflux transporter, RND family, MFP subunit [Caldithrix abyssi DSM 13497]
MNTKKILIIVGVVLLIALIIVGNLLKKDRGIEVLSEKVTRGTVQQKVTGSGQIRPATEVKVSAQVAGKIIRLHVKEGDHVKKGQLLVELDEEKYRANVERAESQLLAAKANEKKAHSELQRTRQLFKRKLVSTADLEAAEANFEAAMSNRLQAEASLKEAQDALDKTKLYATIEGVVTRVNKEEGEMALGAQFQEDVILVVSDLSVMEAVVEIDENDVVNVELGDSAIVEVDAFPDTTFKGMVTEIAHSAITKGMGTTEQVTNFEVTVTIDRPDPRFRPGMSTTVDILTKRLDNVLKVPIQAVTVRSKDEIEGKNKKKSSRADESPKIKDEDLREVVFVIKEGKAVIKPVKLGISDDTHYAVLSGLQEGDEVITGPFRVLTKTLKNGQAVRVKKEVEKD